MNHLVGAIVGRAVKKYCVAVVMIVAVSSLGGCKSVPALRDPVPHTLDGPEKTITQLLTQWEDLTNAAIAATGHTEGWFRGPIQDKKP
ncbi:hypothetical protein [Leifsonia sp. 1010]|uniref:hypothetical protein n=1 Tax=Leifsonia sp. 1010 TaxID=2817769 RepID=UPI002854E7B7|nr:hypothetical protein [Leifsonia sp. 1010]MDR6613287.1 hypothetical protein [Leifsonia sp. 1010]